MVHVDLAFQSSLKDVMEDEYSLLLETFLSDSKLRIEQINDAISQNDADALRKAAHSFKGSSCNIGAPQLTDLCSHAEKIGQDNSMELAVEISSRIDEEFSLVSAALLDILNI